MVEVIVAAYGTKITSAEMARHEFVMKPVRPNALVEAVDRHVKVFPSRTGTA